MDGVLDEMILMRHDWLLSTKTYDTSGGRFTELNRAIGHSNYFQHLLPRLAREILAILVNDLLHPIMLWCTANEVGVTGSENLFLVSIYFSDTAYC